MADVPLSPRTPTKTNRRRSWFRTPQSSSLSSALTANDASGAQSSRGRRYRRHDPTRIKSADALEQLQLLGTGSYGKVFKVKHKRSGQHYALKILSRQKMVAQNMLAQLEEERRIMGCLEPHPHIVGLFSSWSHRDDLYLLLELVEGKDLFELVRTQTRLQGDRAARYLLQIAKGLEYLHRKFIICRDLKLENVLYNSASDTVLITDFGLAKMLSSVESKTQTICGTVQYMAPELLRGEPYDLRLDWWCLGVVAYIMLVGKYPYSRGPEKLAFDRSAKDRAIMLERIAQHPLEFYRPVPKEAQAVVKALLCVDVERRIRTHAELSVFNWFSFSTAALLSDEVSTSDSEHSSVLSVPPSTSADSVFHFDAHDGTYVKNPVRSTPGSTPSPPPMRRSASPTVTSPSRLHQVMSAFDPAPTASPVSAAPEALSARSGKKTRGRRHKRPDPDEFTEDDDIFELLRKYHHRRKEVPQLLPSSYGLSPRTLIRTEGVRASISAGSRSSSPERTEAPTPTRSRNRRGTWTHLFHSRQSSLSGAAVGSDTKSLTDLFGIIQDIQGMQYTDQRSPRHSSTYEVLRLEKHDRDDSSHSEASDDEQARTDAMVQMLSTTPGVTSSSKLGADDSDDSAWNNPSGALDDEVQMVQPTRLFVDTADDSDNENEDAELRTRLCSALWVDKLIHQALAQGVHQACKRTYTNTDIQTHLPPDDPSNTAVATVINTAAPSNDLIANESTLAVDLPPNTSIPGNSPSSPAQVHAQPAQPCSTAASPDSPNSPTAAQANPRRSSNASSSDGSSLSRRSWRSMFRKSPSKNTSSRSRASKAPEEHASRGSMEDVAPPRNRILSTVSMMQEAPLVVVLEPDELETMV
eukprot:m.113376 g.113376  ORF g.113376 m.113376 type:complete len:865 (-) comp15440_c0_seq1:34-2628(-)